MFGVPRTLFPPVRGSNPPSTVPHSHSRDDSVHYKKKRRDSKPVSRFLPPNSFTRTDQEIGRMDRPSLSFSFVSIHQARECVEPAAIGLSSSSTTKESYAMPIMSTQNASVVVQVSKLMPADSHPPGKPRQMGDSPINPGEWMRGLFGGGSNPCHCLYVVCQWCVSVLLRFAVEPFHSLRVGAGRHKRRRDASVFSPSNSSSILFFRVLSSLV